MRDDPATEALTPHAGTMTRFSALTALEHTLDHRHGPPGDEVLDQLTPQAEEP